MPAASNMNLVTFILHLYYDVSVNEIINLLFIVLTLRISVPEYPGTTYILQILKFSLDYPDNRVLFL